MFQSINTLMSRKSASKVKKFFFLNLKAGLGNPFPEINFTDERLVVGFVAEPCPQHPTPVAKPLAPSIVALQPWHKVARLVVDEHHSSRAHGTGACTQVPQSLVDVFQHAE